MKKSSNGSQAQPQQANLPYQPQVLTQSGPPPDLLCPYKDASAATHLMRNAIIVPCCGYFICCEECKFFKFFILFYGQGGSSRTNNDTKYLQLLTR